MKEDFIQAWLGSGTIFSVDSKLILGFGARERLREPHQKQPSFYFPDFFLQNSTPWFHQEYTIEISTEELLALLSPLDNQVNQSYLWRTSHKELFRNVFQDLQARIAAGEMNKGVPYIIESVQKTMGNGQLIKSLTTALSYAIKHSVHLYGFWGEQEGILGATPELLFRQQKDGSIETMACAGTKNIYEDQNEFSSDSKELYEHELVVQGIASSLSPYGEVIIGERQLLKLSKLMHLVTPLSVILSGPLLFQEIVQALHPTPALGAFPKKGGDAWLESLQKKIDRLRYGAPVGLIIPEKKLSHCYVAIRNVQWNRKNMQIAAGCGVVAESDCTKEWDEIQLKLNAIKEILAL